MYIKQLEIDNFKSFANKSDIPMLKGFTAISGPNGSGKSNIIDSIMFALGLRTGSALRIENLSDFITTFNNKNEAMVKVIFGGVDGDKELTVARRIKKTNQGFASTYYLNDKVDTLTNIRTILEKYNITPNSYNVMMQGDVNSIVLCSSKARRGIIDEIAGVADFDRRIDQAKITDLTVEMKSIEPTLLITAPEGTNILLDDEVCTNIGKEFQITEGEHKIKFSIGDYEIVRSISAIKGKTYKANFSLALEINEE